MLNEFYQYLERSAEVEERRKIADGWSYQESEWEVWQAAWYASQKQTANQCVDLCNRLLTSVVGSQPGVHNIAVKQCMDAIRAHFEIG